MEKSTIIRIIRNLITIRDLIAIWMIILAVIIKINRTFVRL